MPRDPRAPALSAAERCRASERAIETHLDKAREATDRAMVECVRAGWSISALARHFRTSDTRISARLKRDAARRSVAR